VIRSHSNTYQFPSIDSFLLAADILRCDGQSRRCLLIHLFSSHLGYSWKDYRWFNAAFKDENDPDLRPLSTDLVGIKQIGLIPFGDMLTLHVIL